MNPERLLEEYKMLQKSRRALCGELRASGVVALKQVSLGRDQGVMVP